MEILTTCLAARPLPIETLLDGAPLYNGLSGIGPPPPLKSSHRQINYFFRTSRMEHDLSFLSFEKSYFYPLEFVIGPSVIFNCLNFLVYEMDESPPSLKMFVDALA